MVQKLFRFLFIFSPAIVVAAFAVEQAQVDFNRDLQPMFRESCYGCHGPSLQSGGLRLDLRDPALAGGVSGKAILPGHGADSLLYRRIAGLGGDAQMPLKGTKLSGDQIALVKAWIDQGAVWAASLTTAPSEAKRHWAYVKPRRPEPPPVKIASWVRNPIDNFILSRLEKSGLQVSPEASKETLIRRITLDLTGLPPTLEEIDAFLSDAGPDAYEKVVDRLLASPRYGERWARPWLDLARYADTNGYEKDNRRSIWLYRDWVINALNRDMPFDRFTIEQIAGDLLPNATIDQKIATGFHRNTMINEEGGVDPEEFRIAAIVDRVDTTAAVWLGSTIGCAQCHNHKFDPFTQEEFYRLFAFFNGTEEEIETFAGSERRSKGTNLTAPAPQALSAHRRLVEDQIAALESQLNATESELGAAQGQWEKESLPLVQSWTLLDPALVSSAAGATLTRLDDGSILASGRSSERESYRIEARTLQTGIRALRLELLSHPTLPGNGLGRGANGNIILSSFSVEIAPESDPEHRQEVTLTDAASQTGANVKLAIDDDPSTGWSVRGVGENTDTHAVFVASKSFGFTGGTRVTIRLKHENAQSSQAIGRFRLSFTTERDAGRSAKLPVRIQKELLTPEGRRTDEQRVALHNYYLTIAPALAPLRERLARLRALWAELSAPGTMVMKELPEPRKTYIHLRGSFLSRGNEVTPGVPAMLHAMAPDLPANRLSLARWLVDPENPLVSRVIVNRTWMHHFGRGIIETVEDFGSQGAAPSHPELLDWLATEFIRKQWSLKAMHRLMVTSATYRQSSRVMPGHLEKDPENRLLARGPRIRLEAETVRDHALAVAGLLSANLGGPSVFPFQPEGIWNLVYNDDKWRISEGEDRYRRSLYTFWRRTAPYPMLLTFDAPSREVICTRRVTTNTPLQSLTTLNDPVFVDAARGVARRIMAETNGGTREGILRGFRLCLARNPDEKELARLTLIFESEHKGMRKNPAAASEIALGGEVMPPKGADEARFAAWTIVANVLLNLDETLTRQ